MVIDYVEDHLDFVTLKLSIDIENVSKIYVIKNNRITLTEIGVKLKEFLHLKTKSALVRKFTGGCYSIILANRNSLSELYAFIEQANKICDMLSIPCSCINLEVGLI